MKVQSGMPSAFERPRKESEKSEGADWRNADAELLRDVVAISSARGGALRFGYSRDRGAYAVGVYVGADYFTDYIRPGEDINDYLRDLHTSFDKYSAPESAPAKRRGH